MKKGKRQKQRHSQRLKATAPSAPSIIKNFILGRCPLPPLPLKSENFRRWCFQALPPLPPLPLNTKGFCARGFQLLPAHSLAESVLLGAKLRLFKLKTTFHSHYSHYSQLYIEIVAVYKKRLKISVVVLYGENMCAVGAGRSKSAFGVIS